MRIEEAGTMDEQIKAAIGVHALWKGRILEAIAKGTSDWDPTFVKPCGNCDFGKWLNGFEAGQKDDHYQTVYKLHADFHVEAARVLTMALAGQKEEAENSIVDRSTYSNLTQSLTRAMMDWRRALVG